MGRDQGRTIAEDDTLEQKRITRQMILRAQVDFVSAFLEGLSSPVNFTPWRAAVGSYTQYPRKLEIEIFLTHTLSVSDCFSILVRGC